MKGFKDSKKKFHPIKKSKGVRMKRFDKSEIQSLIFPKRKFSISDAKKWAKTHDFKANKADVTKNNIRIRQFNPNEIKRGGECRTIHLGSSNVQGVLCEVGVMRKKRFTNDEYPYDITKADPVLETGLDDIFDPIMIKKRGIDTEKIDHDKLDHVAKSEIEYILEREKKLGKGEMVDVTLVSVRPETSREEFDRTGKGETGFYQYDYKIFKNGKITPFAGTAFGSISMGHVIDMNLELYDVRKLE